MILDVDGTLVASNDAHARAWVEALAEQGREVPFARVRPLIGMGGDQLLPELGIDPESDEGRRVSARRGELFRERELPRLRATPGAGALVARLEALGFALVVASSADEEDLEPLLEIAGAPHLVRRSTSSADADRSKPAPDLVEAALGLLDRPPERVLLLGDTPYDVAAAARAGVAAVAVRSGGWADEDLGGALAIYDHPAHLLAELDASPLCTGRVERG